MYKEFGFTDFYKVLGVDRTASTAEIKEVFRNLARKYHPDKSEMENTTETFKLILHAYNVLIDQKQRVRHNLDLLGRHFAEHDHNANRNQKQSQSQSQEQHGRSPDSSKRVLLLELLRAAAKWFRKVKVTVAKYSLFWDYYPIVAKCSLRTWVVLDKWIVTRLAHWLRELTHAVAKYSGIVIPVVAKWSLRTLGHLAKWIVITLAHWLVQFLSGRSIVANLVIFGFAGQILTLLHCMGMLRLFVWIITRLMHIALIVVIFGVKLLMNFLLNTTRL